MRVKKVLDMLYEVAIREAQIAREMREAQIDREMREAEDYDVIAFYYDHKIRWLNHRRYQSLRATNEDFIRGECLQIIPEIRGIAEAVYSESYDDPYLHASTIELLEYVDKIEKNIRGGKTK